MKQQNLIEYNIKNGKVIFDIKNIVNNLQNTKVSDVILLLKIGMIESFLGDTLVCGINLDSEELLLNKNKTNLLKVIEILIDSLIDNYPSLNEKLLLKRKIRLAIDKAENNFSLIIEFSTFSTTVSFISTPKDKEEQKSFHTKNITTDIIEISATSDMFNDFDLVSVLNIEKIIRLSNYIGNINFEYSLKNINRDFFKSEIEFILSNDPVIKIAQLDYLSKLLNTFVPNEERINDFTKAILLLRSSYSLMGMRIILSQ